MGQKINPTGFRLSVTKNWTSRWYANNTDFAKMLKEDVDVRLYLKKKLKNASVSKVIIERPAKNARITIYSARPGVVIGKKGEDIESLRNALRAKVGGEVNVAIEEIRNGKDRSPTSVGDFREEDLIALVVRNRAGNVARLIH